MTSDMALQTRWLFSNKQSNDPNIIAVACSDRGAGDDPEGYRLVSLRTTFTNAPA